MTRHLAFPPFNQCRAKLSHPQEPPHSPQVSRVIQFQSATANANRFHELEPMTLREQAVRIARVMVLNDFFNQRQ